jgi:hypothetical protein
VPWNTFDIGPRYSDAFLDNVWRQEQYQGKQYEDSNNHDVQSSYFMTNLTWSRALPSLSKVSWVSARTGYVKIQNALDQTYIVDLGGGIQSRHSVYGSRRPFRSIEFLMGADC